MKRIFAVLLLFSVLVISGCSFGSKSATAEALEKELEQKAASYTQPDGLSDAEWKEESMLRAKKELAESRGTLPEYLSILASDDSVNVRTRVAKNPATPAGVSEQFAGSAQEIIRNYTAANTALPQKLLDRLSRDESPVVRQAAAANPKNSAENFKLLAADPDINVQNFLARNRSLTTEAMLIMTEKSPISALGLLLKRANLPPEVVDKLRHHQDEKIRKRANAYNPQVPE